MSRLMTESLLRWRLNGRDMRTILCSPGQERALLTGLLLTGRMIDGPEQVQSLRREEGLWLVEADTLFPDFPDLAKRLESMPTLPEAPLPEGARLLALQKALGTGGITPLIRPWAWPWSAKWSCPRPSCACPGGSPWKCWLRPRRQAFPSCARPSMWAACAWNTPKNGKFASFRQHKSSETKEKTI